MMPCGTAIMDILIMAMVAVIMVADTMVAVDTTAVAVDIMLLSSFMQITIMDREVVVRGVQQFLPTEAQVIRTVAVMMVINKVTL